MHRSLSRHDEILREAIEKRGGYVFKTVGDAFCCAFLTTLDALEAALEAQRTLLGEEWEGTHKREDGFAHGRGRGERRGLLRSSCKQGGEAAFGSPRRAGAALAPYSGAGTRSAPYKD